MSNNNQLFLKKYNELDVLCRNRYDMFRTKEGKRNNLSAIREYANSLPDMYKDNLYNLIKLRNLIAHTNSAQASEQSIRDLESFIVMIKKNVNPKNKDAFDVASYVNHNAKKMRRTINELYSSDDDNLSFDIKKRITNELYGYVNNLEAAQDINRAKKIVNEFYSYLDSIDEHPLVVKKVLQDAKAEAIEELTESYNNVLDERSNPFIRMKAKMIFNRYKEFVLNAKTEDEVEDLGARGSECLDDLY